MDRTWAGGGIAKTHFSGEFGVSRGHKGCHLLMADLHVFHPVLGLLERDIQTSDSIPRIPVDPLQTPLGQALPNILADVHASPPDEAPSRRKLLMRSRALPFRPTPYFRAFEFLRARNGTVQ